jgi:hypothetical protein
LDKNELELDAGLELYLGSKAVAATVWFPVNKDLAFML